MSYLKSWITFGEKIEIEKVVRVDRKYGLKLTLYPVNQSEGIKVYIHNQTERPSDRNMFIITNGMETTLTIERVFEEKLGKPYNAYCKRTTNVEVNDTTVREFQYYQNDCIKLCQSINAYEKCGGNGVADMKKNFYMTG